MGHFATVPPAAITRILSGFERDELAGFIAVAIDLLDLADGDLDLEEDDPPEEGGDHLDAAWLERDDQRRIAVGGINSNWFPGISEDAEEDDPQGELTDDEPAFDKRSCRIANRHGDGPGCKISDPDHGREEAGEQEEGAGIGIYGIDQTKLPPTTDWFRT